MLDRDASLAVNECSISKRCRCGMAPSPENDSAPKAPDKPRHDKCGPKENNKDDKTLSDLNDGELKGLLDEALNYKNPKDREGKSKLFNHLLNEAEEDERNARAARAGGSELVRYCNPSAKRNSRHRKKPSSISENMMHGGSLDNLAKEELFETSKHRTKKSVSARQREGGSLPCNVNSSTIGPEYQFLEEARKKKQMSEKKPEVVEEQRLLEHDTLDQNYQEKSNELQQQYKFTTRASLQVNVSEYEDIDRNRTVEKQGLQPRVPVFHVLMSRGGPYNEVDGPIQIPHLEQTVDRKNCVPNKSIAQIVGPDCAGTIRISNELSKVDENGNALHQTSLKAKKKKVLTDKNVVVCNAENVKGHRSDIINDMEKLMEFIGIPNDQSEKNRSIKSKLNRHSSDDTTKSKKRAHSSKSKDNRSKLKKSNSLGEISTTNLDDFEFNKDNVVLRNNKNVIDKPRERRSWGNMEPLPLQNLYNSAENLESAEFRVVTKKKKSKKRHNSISGRTKTSSNPNSKSSVRGPSPRRKSACSVPHSEKSNDSSDVDSVHSLPIDTQRLDLATSRPISYADMAKTNDKQTKERKLSDKIVPKETITDGRCAIIATVPVCDSSVRNTPPDFHNSKNFPAITKQVYVVATDKNKCSNKVKNVNVKNVKNNVNKMGGEPTNEFKPPPNQEDSDPMMGYSSSLPPDIPDVQTIEKMQLMNQGYDSPLNNGNDCSVDCDNPCERTTIDNNHHRPPVVILSGLGNSKEVPGLVFGFDINEQLLSEDNNKEFCCDDFISRYVAPETYTTKSHNHDKIVHFIGAAWEEALVNLSNGKVQYYDDLL
ncbi:uncharacterized protein LOC123008604 isoform X2 [Tribolium madens]|uniref:uncharacterized protein LOC123008604 isoform X2 n=1 Tax=Tribolium madens TaxID=41895 RepID=UPI001CF75BD2|nr:uncharacterized protein LOC123008604 isoform X2 [Tribolium madens]